MDEARRRELLSMTAFGRSVLEDEEDDRVLFYRDDQPRGPDGRFLADGSVEARHATLRAVSDASIHHELAHGDLMAAIKHQFHGLKAVEKLDLARRMNVGAGAKSGLEAVSRVMHSVSQRKGAYGLIQATWGRPGDSYPAHTMKAMPAARAAVAAAKKAGFTGEAVRPGRRRLY
jgi:hypothetical protein